MVAPLVVIRPMNPVPAGPPFWLVYHSAPSGPVTISTGSSMFGPAKVVTFPAVVIRPIRPWLVAVFPKSVNHSAPSGPTAMS